LLAEGEISADFFEVTFPGIKVIHSEGEMVVLMAWEKGRAKIGDKMQFLVVPSRTMLREGKRGRGMGSSFNIR